MILLLLRSLFGRRPAAPGVRRAILAAGVRCAQLAGGRGSSVAPALRTAVLAGGRAASVVPAMRTVHLEAA